MSLEHSVTICTNVSGNLTRECFFNSDGDWSVNWPTTLLQTELPQRMFMKGLYDIITKIIGWSRDDRSHES